MYTRLIIAHIWYLPFKRHFRLKSDEYRCLEICVDYVDLFWNFFKNSIVDADYSHNDNNSIAIIVRLDNQSLCADNGNWQWTLRIIRAAKSEPTYAYSDTVLTGTAVVHQLLLLQQTMHRCQRTTHCKLIGVTETGVGSVSPLHCRATYSWLDGLWLHAGWGGGSSWRW